MKNLADKKCEPCEGGAPPMNTREVEEYLNELNGWRHEEGKIKKSFKYKNFKEAMIFVNKVADIAESEGHHPDIWIHYKPNPLLPHHGLESGWIDLSRRLRFSVHRQLVTRGQWNESD